MVHHCPNHYCTGMSAFYHFTTTDLSYSPWNNPNHLLDSLFFKEFSHIRMPVISHWGVSCPVSSPAPHLAWFWSVVIIQIICHWEFLVLLLIPNTRHMGLYGVWREIDVILKCSIFDKNYLLPPYKCHETIYVWCHYQNYFWLVKTLFYCEIQHRSR